MAISIIWHILRLLRHLAEELRAETVVMVITHDETALSCHFNP